MLTEAFWNNVNKLGPQKVEVSGRCWVWKLGVDSQGYARFRDPQTNRLRPAHCLTLEAKLGRPIQQGLEVDHLCGTRNCVRPSHLEEVTRQENARRALAGKPSNNPNLAASQRAKTECRNGHPFSPDNTYVFPNGRRRCQTCQRKHRKTYNRKRESA